MFVIMYVVVLIHWWTGGGGLADWRWWENMSHLRGTNACSLNQILSMLP